MIGSLRGNDQNGNVTLSEGQHVSVVGRKCCQRSKRRR
jgi:hypothetical protein